MNIKYIKLGALAVSLLYVDLFCGAGGTSTGVETARVHGEQCAKVIACVNHDANAIASHAANHPETLHFTEDIRTLNVNVDSELVRHVVKMRRMYPFAKLVLWASLECTNFSKAKGGLARDADSRTLAEHLHRYIIALNPDSVQIENVEEFMSWGKMCENGKPISRFKGRDFMSWIDKVKYGYGRYQNRMSTDIYDMWFAKMKELGSLKRIYNYDHRILNSADFGALTSRKRFFAQFNKPGFPTVWPEPTHAKNPVSGLFESLEKWRAVKEVLDFEDEGKSIFGRKKPLVEASLDRIWHGLVKFVAGGKDKWLLKYNSRSKSGVHIPPGIDDPCPTVSCQGRLGLVSTDFLSKYFSGKPQHKNISVDGPCGTIKTIDSHALIQPKFLSAYYGNGFTSSVDEPSPTVTTGDRFSLINAKFLTSYNYKDEPKSLDQPCPTLLTKDRFSLISSTFIDQQFGNSKPASVESPLGALTANPKYAKVSTFIMNQYSGGGQTSDINGPAPTILGTPKQNLITCENWVMNTNFNNTGNSIDEPAPTITANRKWHYLMDAQYSRVGNSINQPCFTLIARMDKTPPYLVEITQEGDLPSFIKIDGNVIIYEIYEDDSPMLKKIKEFMAMYGLTDIKMRMLKIPELKQIMGFPEDYVLIGTQAEQKKYIGNAVEVTMARKICEATAHRMYWDRKEKIA